MNSQNRKKSFSLILGESTSENLNRKITNSYKAMKITIKQITMKIYFIYKNIFL